MRYLLDKGRNPVPTHLNRQSISGVWRNKDWQNGRRTGTVSNDARKEGDSHLLHFHVCIHCGAAFRREEVEGRVHTIGLFLCSKCGREGPLNIEIREIDNVE